MKLYIKSETAVDREVEDAVVRILQECDKQEFEGWVGKSYDRIVSDILEQTTYSMFKNKEFDEDSAEVLITDKITHGMHQIILDKFFLNYDGDGYMRTYMQPGCIETDYRYKKRLKKANEELNADPERKCKEAWDQFQTWLDTDEKTGGLAMKEYLDQRDIEKIKARLDKFVLSNKGGNIRNLKFWYNPRGGFIKVQSGGGLATKLYQSLDILDEDSMEYGAY